MTSFQHLGLAENLLKGVRAAGYETPTPIQAATIPTACSGQDVIGCAQTGTGKTAAFVLPMLERLAAHRPKGKRRPVRALVVTPTRELALQVEAAVRTYGQFTRLYSATIFGGVGMGPQIKALRRGVDLVVATPGRLLDHMERGNLDLSRVEMLVLDEADRMLDMGFIHDIRKILAAVPEDRQTLLFSATMAKNVQKFARSIVARDAAFVEVDRESNTAETVAQHVCAVPNHQKMDLLLHVLEAEPIESVLVFSRTKHRADRITRRLNKKGFSATALHSNKSQPQRQRALDGFRRGRFQVLVATDIAARGIDVDTISHVINYDTPNEVEAYIHRIGRTGRAEATGDAISFVANDERAYLHNIERHTGQRLERRTYEDFALEEEVDLEAPRPRKNHGSRKAGGRYHRKGKGGYQGRRKSPARRSSTAER